MTHLRDFSIFIFVSISTGKSGKILFYSLFENCTEETIRLQIFIRFKKFGGDLTGKKVCNADLEFCCQITFQNDCIKILTSSFSP